MVHMTIMHNSPVRVVSRVHVDTGRLREPLVIDGVVVDRRTLILLTAQHDARENGIHRVRHRWRWFRRYPMLERHDTGANQLHATHGTAYACTDWVCRTDGVVSNWTQWAPFRTDINYMARSFRERES